MILVYHASVHLQHCDQESVTDHLEGLTPGAEFDLVEPG